MTNINQHQFWSPVLFYSEETQRGTKKALQIKLKLEPSWIGAGVKLAVLTELLPLGQANEIPTASRKF